MTIYGRSKLCNFLLVHELSRKLSKGAKGTESDEEEQVSVNIVNPGAVDSELGRETPWYLGWIVKPISKIFFKTTRDGAGPAVWACTTDKITGISGKYWDGNPVVEKKPKDYAFDSKVSGLLWDYCLELVGDIGDDKEKEEKKEEKEEKEEEEDEEEIKDE